MRLKLIRPWGRHREGEIIDPPDGQANEMVRRGIAEPVPEQVETATYPKRGKR